MKDIPTNFFGTIDLEFEYDWTKEYSTHDPRLYDIVRSENYFDRTSGREVLAMIHTVLNDQEQVFPSDGKRIERKIRYELPEFMNTHSRAYLWLLMNNTDMLT